MKTCEWCVIIMTLWLVAMLACIGCKGVDPSVRSALENFGAFNYRQITNSTMTYTAETYITGIGTVSINIPLNMTILPKYNSPFAQFDKVVLSESLNVGKAQFYNQTDIKYYINGKEKERIITQIFPAK